MEDDWFLTFHDNQQSCHFGGVPEAEVPYDIAWVNVGDLGRAAGQRGTLWHGSSWIPKELEPLGELARDFSFVFFLAFQSGKDEIPLGCRWRWKDIHWGNGWKVMLCDSCVSETESQCKWFSRKAWNTFIQTSYKRLHLHQDVHHDVQHQNCFDLRCPPPQRDGFGFGQVHSLSRSSHQKMGGQSRRNASHIAHRAANLVGWRCGYQNLGHEVRLGMSVSKPSKKSQRQLGNMKTTTFALHDSGSPFVDIAAILSDLLVQEARNKRCHNRTRSFAVTNDPREKASPWTDTGFTKALQQIQGAYLESFLPADCTWHACNICVFARWISHLFCFFLQIWSPWNRSMAISVRKSEWRWQTFTQGHWHRWKCYEMFLKLIFLEIWKFPFFLKHVHAFFISNLTCSYEIFESIEFFHGFGPFPQLVCHCKMTSTPWCLKLVIRLSSQPSGRSNGSKATS